MTTIDRTGASDAEFQARIAAFDAAPTPPECDPERVETVARALRNRAREAFDTPCDMDCDQADCPSCGQPIQAFSFINDVPDTIFGDVVAIAAAAIAALPPSPAEEAVKRVEALADEWDCLAEVDRDALATPTHLLYRDHARKARAALASPAPAPQGEPCGVDPCDCDHPSHDERAKTAAACRRFNQKLIDGAR